MEIPLFETERLILRSVSAKDIPSYTRYFVNYEVIRHLANSCPWPYPENGVERYVRTYILPYQGRDKWVWGIFLKTDPENLIGVVDLWRQGSPENRGFWLGQPFWGKGYMTEAVEPVMTYAFGPLGFDKLTFANAFGNTRSRRIKEKTGANFLYTIDRNFVDPSYIESEIWELKREDWQSELLSQSKV